MHRPVATAASSAAQQSACHAGAEKHTAHYAHMRGRLPTTTTLAFAVPPPPLPLLPPPPAPPACRRPSQTARPQLQPSPARTRWARAGGGRERGRGACGWGFKGGGIAYQHTYDISIPPQGLGLGTLQHFDRGWPAVELVRGWRLRDGSGVRRAAVARRQAGGQAAHQPVIVPGVVSKGRPRHIHRYLQRGKCMHAWRTMR